MVYTMEGEQLPAGMPSTNTQTHCLNETQASDMEKTVRTAWEDRDCVASSIEKSDNTLSWEATCQDGTFNVNGEMIIQDKEHYTSTMINDMDGMKMTMTSEARWVGPCSE